MIKRVFISILSLLTVSASAQRVLTIEDALTMGYQQNPSMEAASAAVDVMRSRSKAAFGYRLPNIGVTASYTLMAKDLGVIDFNDQKDHLLGALGQLGLPIPPALGQLISGLDLSYTLQKRNFAMVGANVAMPLYMGGKINALNRASKLNLSKAEEQALAARIELFSQITERYWGLALGREVEALLLDVSKGMEHHYQDALKLEENGMIARGERLFAQMHVTQSEAAYQKSKRDAQTINIALGGSIGLKEDYQPVTPLFLSSKIESLEYFQTQVAANNHLLKQVDITRQLAEQAVKAEFANYLPEVAAMGAYDIWNHQLSNQIPRWVVGAGVKINLFDGLTREHNYRAAKSQVRQVEAVERQAQVDLATMVEKLYNDMLNAREQAMAWDSSIEFAVEYLRIKEQAFVEGMANSSAVVDARLNLAKSRTERLAAIYTFDMKLCQLLALAGETDRLSQYFTK